MSDMPDKIYVPRQKLGRVYFDNPDGSSTEYIRADLVPAFDWDRPAQDKPRLRKLLNEPQVLTYESPAVDIESVLVECQARWKLSKDQKQVVLETVKKALGLINSADASAVFSIIETLKPTVDLRMVLENLGHAQTALACARHLLSKYGDTKSHHWLNNYDRDIKRVKDTIAHLKAAGVK
jgi:hypothetical protein